ncbi:MAG: hypothetical protein QXY98_01075, partial [Thermoplasmata archaeon]
LADDVAIMHRGKIIAKGTPGGLIEKYGKGTSIVLENAGQTGLKILRAMGIDAELDRINSNNVVVAVRRHSEMKSIMARLASSDISVTDIWTMRESLEDVFLSLVGSKMEDGVLRQ